MANLQQTAVQLEDSGLYRMTCAAGHETVTSLQQMRFEILFDLGAHAIIDGYYIEAVSSFASALERFFEFYVDIQCLRRGITESVYSEAWKQVSNQSERQLGAFIFMYLAETRESPRLLPPKAIEFRNGVIHKGKLPSREQTVEFGEHVLNVIVPILAKVRIDAEADVQKLVGRHIVQIRKGIPSSDGGYMCMPTIISLSRATTEKQPSLREWISQYEAERRRYGIVPWWPPSI